MDLSVSAVSEAPAVLPTGTVAFLFGDIEGSARLVYVYRKLGVGSRAELPEARVG
jgi:hypothetical protein